MLRTPLLALALVACVPSGGGADGGHADSGPQACNPACPDTLACVAGSCAPRTCTPDAGCPEGLGCIGGFCADQSCAPPCPAGQACLDSLCLPEQATPCASGADCAAPLACVGGHCADQSCNPPCDAGSCVQGACLGAAPSGCAAGYSACPAPFGQACANLSSDPQNCGGCGRTCPADRPACEQGACSCLADQAFVADAGAAVCCSGVENGGLCCEPIAAACGGNGGCCQPAECLGTEEGERCVGLGGAPCSAPIDCVSGICDAGVCACTPNGKSFWNSGYECCSNRNSPEAVCCAATGEACAASGECCSGLCLDGGACACSPDGARTDDPSQCCTGQVISAACCEPPGGPCDAGTTCCSGSCTAGACACTQNGGPETNATQCCSQNGDAPGQLCCGLGGTACASDQQCCSKSCDAGVCDCTATGQPFGNSPTEGPLQCCSERQRDGLCCAGGGTPCDGGGFCCSGSCVAGACQ